MSYGLASQTPLVVKGLGVMIGEWLFGPSGPILFHGLGLGFVVATTLGVLLGAGLGYFVASAAWSMHHRRPTPRHTGYGVRSTGIWEQACGSEGGRTKVTSS